MALDESLRQPASHIFIKLPNYDHHVLLTGSRFYPETQVSSDVVLSALNNHVYRKVNCDMSVLTMQKVIISNNEILTTELNQNEVHFLCYYIRIQLAIESFDFLYYTPQWCIAIDCPVHYIQRWFLRKPNISAQRKTSYIIQHCLFYSDVCSSSSINVQITRRTLRASIPLWDTMYMKTT